MKESVKQGSAEYNAIFKNYKGLQSKNPADTV